MSNIERLRDGEVMRVLINASDSLNITRAHELGGKTRTICDEEGLLELGRAIESAVHAKLSAPVEVVEAPVATDAAYEMLMALAGVDTHDMNLRDHPDAWAAVERYSASLVEQQARRIEAYEKIINNDSRLLGDMFASIAQLEARLSRQGEVIKKAIEAQEQAKRWIEQEMRDRGVPDERLDDPPVGSHLYALRDSLAELRSVEGRS